jgi:hypothetical protein
MITPKRFVVRLVTSDDKVTETEFDDGRAVATRSGRSQSTLPTLEMHIPRLSGDLDPASLQSDPSLHDRVLIVSHDDDGERLQRMFPLCVVPTRLPAAYLPRFNVLWILRGAPFGTFAWRLQYLDGRCLLSDAVAWEDALGMEWDLTVESDFIDCVLCFLGEIEGRDLLDLGRVQGPLASLSTASWIVEREETAELARVHRSEALLLAAWARALGNAA